ncbi:MAG: hypothetical protein ACXVCD_08660 [Pseudobdellovibrionaceae bacterium]
MERGRNAVELVLHLNLVGNTLYKIFLGVNVRTQRMFSNLSVTIGFILMVSTFQNCTKAKFIVDEAAKQKVLGDSNVLGGGNDGSIMGNPPGNDAAIPGGNTSGNDPAIPGGNTLGNDPAIPGGSPLGNDFAIPGRSPLGNDFAIPGRSPLGNDTAIPGGSPLGNDPNHVNTPPLGSGQDPAIMGSNAISLVPNPVCGPILSTQATLTATDKITAVIYQKTADSLKFIQALDSAADVTNTRTQLAALKPFQLKLKSPLAPGTYMMVMYDASKVKAPYGDISSISMGSGAGAVAVAPIMDSVVHLLDSMSTFVISASGAQRAPQTMNVLVGARGQPQCQNAGMIDPLILQLNTQMPQPITLTSPENGVMFDMLGQKADHEKVKVAWFASAVTENYFLVLPNSDGQVLGIDEMFGDATLGPDKKYAKQGFDALAKYDENKDFMISEDDSVFPQLRLWKDANLDGIVQPEELFTLDAKGVVAIDLRYDRRYRETDQYGNTTKFKSIVIMKDNTYGLVFDLWLRFIK